MRSVSEQRQRLLGVKLRSLVGRHLAIPMEDDSVGVGGGAACMVDHRAWVIIEGPAERSLGGALAWAIRHGATTLDVIADEGAGVMVRRSAGFDVPIQVWTAHEHDLLPVGAGLVDVAPEPAARHLDLLELIADAGAEPHVERGVVTGEVRGLEVCRVVDEPTTGRLLDESGGVLSSPVDRRADEVLLEVGVGATDREAFQIMHGHLPTVDALAGVVRAVAEHRAPGTRQHPLNRMAPERFLRWTVITDPDRLGLASLEAVDPPIERQSMKHPEPCVARGVDRDGRSVTAVFSTGVDLDLVPFAADVAVSALATTDRTIVVVPSRDLVPITRDLAARLTSHVEFDTIDL